MIFFTLESGHGPVLPAFNKIFPEKTHFTFLFDCSDYKNKEKVNIAFFSGLSLKSVYTLRYGKSRVDPSSKQEN